MKITISLRGTLVKFFGDSPERTVDVPEGCTCDEALKTVGLDYTQIPRFGFVAINGKRVMITETLKEGDQLKAYSRISGG